MAHHAIAPASAGRRVAAPELFETSDVAAWERAYSATIDPKYAKHGRKFGETIGGARWPADDETPPPIYVIPRIRGASYKSVALEGATAEQLFFAPVSKGFAMQEVSSFSLGPIVGEGLCLVNAAFSKMICAHHIEGGGRLDLGRRSFWRRARVPARRIELVRPGTIRVDGREWPAAEWLRENEPLWLGEWERWRRAVALCGRGDFHWTDATPVVGFRVGGEYVDFANWKKRAYIAPSYALLPQTRVFPFLRRIWREERRPLGLVHPKARSWLAESPVTAAVVRELFDSPDTIACQPYVIAGLLLGVPVDGTP